jgi:hypothetical protein
METLVINLKTKKDKQLFEALAERLNLKLKFVTDEDKLDYGLLKAMLATKRGDLVDRKTILKALQK